MKIKKIKLLKALALTGAFGIVATVPVIVSSCSSTSDNNVNGNGGQGGDQQTQTSVKPDLKSEVNLSGKLTGVYDTSADNRKDTNTLISDDIKANPDKYFNNAADIKDAIKDAKVTVNGNFSASEWNTQGAKDYAEWSKDNSQAIPTVTYPTAAKQIDIASLNELKTVTFKDSDTISTFITESKITIDKFSEMEKFRVENKLHLSSGDLLHVNLKADNKTTGQAGLNLDLQIPVSNINLKTSLTVSVDATTNTTGNKIEAVSDLKTNFSYNIGIDSTVNFTDPKISQSLTKTEADDATEVLKKLGYAGTDGTIDNDKVSAAIGVYNCKFTAVSSKEDTTVSAKTGKKAYKVTLSAEPFDSNYVWDDGQIGAKQVDFTVQLTVNN
ncbi:P35 lipoprotein homolog [Malacoplasma penetrans HF-2]|uniref:P35 lipoprotein homolog n=1 Tax=Malacoplasma penetrans (strain HF-2) TaxID=272633 RepID=Q8EV98_MALP2|nr:P35 family lipoprotein [Malacoplasma penetrans]BAC44460.1 P35 lipoprotein homolog [Malacoplasma penetrans HF-2]